ncbi:MULTISPECIES: HAD family hydrolase [Micromonospora]|uniref:HAD family phosphatase n=1 Tax=Micromonospora aurantiaca (nom. illeg.) TaxID=47850 RepID=A0ABQ6UA32_9ACTN|nr:MULTISPECIES: HAD family phosphatase [Micromonospora]KAB1107575.1 HAD family phosphatase [Micromonospora aurantiaca]MBC9006196.1 HAD family phosphatase [Micromonospora aurantiaca]MDG4751412.1 HAD family phosphatase [Micromonospora sp. WMMD718]UFN97307.1 HAD family phosphatase [Micromonospora aurantiaca]
MLFDMDGTLVDSEKLWDVALQELAAVYGGVLSEDARRAIVGTGMADAMRIVHDDLGQPERDVQESADWISARILDLFRTGLRWRPGALALLRAVRDAGIPTALVTSSGRSLVEVALDTLGRDSFDAVVCGDEVDSAKPHPEPYLTAARLLGVPVERCVAIEDSPTGVASALAAGAAVLAVPAEVPLAPADGVHQLESLLAADLELLAALLNR